ARISHLAYAPEIAAAMLQRQQAAAMVSNLLIVLCSEKSTQPTINSSSSVK
ncbi:MAG: SPFH domain-containing protein, partial [Clostridium sp.]